MIDILPVFLPLLGALLTFIAGRGGDEKIPSPVACGVMVLSTFISLWLFYDVAIQGLDRTHILYPWISAGAFQTQWAVRLDTLSVVMMAVVTTVSTLVHIYAVAYMKGEKSFARFISYLSLFTFFMLLLVCANDLLQLFVGWEGVGFCSYLLIGFWHEKPTANAASIKAFVVNRCADVFFLLGLFGTFAVFGSLSFDVIFDHPALAQSTHVFSFAKMSFGAMPFIASMLLIGAMGKSAQIGFHVWLPDAMEGPTPVSALIHAATMVTAGVFLLARMSPLMEMAPSVLAVVAVVGALTSLMAAALALTENDIKRVIAYSTMSQLGYMFVAIGVSAYGAAIFHLATHAFFKALLFLGSGIVIHALSGEQDMRDMGGLRKKMPYTYALMLIASLSLTGIGLGGFIGFSGYYSKEAILRAAEHSTLVTAQFAYVVGLIVTVMTALYTGRMMIMTFHGDCDHHAHEGKTLMLVPCALLGVGALFGGAVFNNRFVGSASRAFWGYALETNALVSHSSLIEWPVVLAIMGLAGISYYYYAHRKIHWPILLRLCQKKFYVDYVYDHCIVQPLYKVARLCAATVEGWIDRFGSDGAAVLSFMTARAIHKTQNGRLNLYALAFASGLALFVLLLFVRG